MVGKFVVYKPLNKFRNPWKISKNKGPVPPFCLKNKLVNYDFQISFAPIC